MQRRSESFWHRFKITNAYGQLIALIFVPIMILSTVGAGLVLFETARSTQAQQAAAASAILTRYQKTSGTLLKLIENSPSHAPQAQSILQYILNEPDLMRAALIDMQGNSRIYVGYRQNSQWPQFSINSNLFGPIKRKESNIYGMRVGYSEDGPIWLVVELNNQGVTIARYRVWLVLSITGLFTLLLLLLCLNFYSRRWIAPMYEIRLQLQQLNADSLGKSFQTNTSGELALLQKDIATLLKRLHFSFLELREYTEQTEDDLRKTLDTLEVQNITYKKARDQAISANQAKSVFLANISHELRTPLNSVDGFINLMLRRGKLSDENLLYVQTIRKSSSHLLALINDVLDFSKIDAGKLELEVAPFNLEEAIFDVMDMLSPLACEKRIDMAISFDSNLPEIVQGDVLRFKQILTNLVSNAIKFTPEGDIIVRARLEQNNYKEITAHFSIQDSGIGLSGAARKNLFSSFSQGDTSVTRQYGGTGLGLAISKQLVSLMHGKIGFEDNQERNPTEKGATFWFTAQFTVDPEKTNELIVLKQYKVLSYIAHSATAHIFKQYLEEYQIPHHETASILDLFSRLNTFNHQENTWLIVDYSQDTEALLKEIRTRYTGPLAIYGYQMLLEPKLLQQYHATVLSQPLNRSHLLNLFTADKKAAPVETFNGRGLHILAVDDHLPNLIVLEALLNELNVKVTTALSGQIALNRVQECLDSGQQLFDLIFMDIQMPIMSGLETTQAIRAIESTQEHLTPLPIIALTAHAMADEKEKLLKSGLNDYVTKPIQMGQLIQILSTWTKAKDITPQHTPAILEHIPNTTSLNSSGHQEIIDWQQSIELAANKPALAQDLLRMLIESFDKEREEMQQLIEDEDFPQLEHNLHRLYGATRYVGVPHLQEVSGEFEQFVSQLRKQKQVADEAFIEQVLHRYQLLIEAMEHIKALASNYLKNE